jgi:hypothetical protein
MIEREKHKMERLLRTLVATRGLILAGTLTLAAIGGYFGHSYDQPASAGVTHPVTAAVVTTHCTTVLLAVAPDIACDDR